MNGGYMTVKVDLPLDEYRLLYAEAEKHRTTVAQIIQARITTPKVIHQPRPGRPSAYTTEMGHRIAAGRQLNMSWPEIARKLGIDTHKARDWFTKFENERTRAESRRTA